MKLGLAGLGKMGAQVATKLIEAGHDLVVDSRHMENTQPLIDLGAANFQTYEDLIPELGEKPIVWLMIQHKYVPDEVDKLLELLPKGSIIVDGGNSDWRSTKKVAAKCQAKGVYLVDVGTSGGVWGEKNGFSMMVGGSEEAVNRIKPLLDVLAKPSAAWYRFGDSGAGHFVKMVHNGVEYGIMQSFAEGYRVIKEGPYDKINLGMVADIWQHKSINESFLNSLIERMLKRDSDFEGVEGKVAESGEARWTLETARELGIPTPAIQTAFDERLKSQDGEVHWGTKFLAQLRNEFGGHAINIEDKQ
ncbi:MAG: NADP-dependent phosphogluconate dehydrogenase [Candidatus Saccharimonadales bacterium]|nr:NADP-dependent phosphogluconate dehydrogenase [Candidatus Saccharimonadales bacterium]